MGQAFAARASLAVRLSGWAADVSWFSERFLLLGDLRNLLAPGPARVLLQGSYPRHDLGHFPGCFVGDVDGVLDVFLAMSQ